MSEEVQEMLNDSIIEPGAVVTGRVMSFDDKRVTVDIGYKFQGIVPIRELSALRIDHPSEVVKEGDDLKLVVIKIDEEAEVIILSKRQADAEGAWEYVQEKFTTGESFEVFIKDVVKGGLVTDLGIRGFIPASLVDRHFVDDLSQFKGKSLRVRVVEFDPEHNKLILSRKAVLDEEVHQQQEQAMANLQEGEIIEGAVQRLTDFGVFVDVGGVDGLVHISELAWHHVEHPSDYVKPGDRVRVRVLRLDPGSGRISLSMKEAEASPWERYANEFQPGDVVKGIVRRLVDFGAFVELKPGLEGLVHISQLSNEHVAKPSDVLEEGQEVNVRVLSVDVNQQRIALSMRETTRERRPEPARKEPTQRYTEKSADSTSGTGATLGDLFGDLFKRQ